MPVVLPNGKGSAPNIYPQPAPSPDLRPRENVSQIVTNQLFVSQPGQAPVLSVDAIQGITSTTGVRTSAGAATTVTVGSSPFTYTNASTSNQQVFVLGGTVSALSFNPNGGAGIALTATASNILVLRPNDQLVITYTAAPTVKAIQL